LKGAARDPLRKLAVVWGDSVVFGIGWSWPCLLDAFAPGYQFLNGGIVADPYDNVLRRAAAFNQANAVALNIVMPGWHPVSYASPLARPRRGLSALLHRMHKELPNFRRKSPAAPQLEARISVPHISHQNQPLRATLLRFLETTPNTVLVTMPTPLNRNIVGQDLSPYFVRGNRRVRFNFLGDFPICSLVDIPHELASLVRVALRRLPVHLAIDPPAAIASVVALRIADLIQTVRLLTRPGFREAGFSSSRVPGLTRRYPVFAHWRNRSVQETRNCDAAR